MSNNNLKNGYCWIKNPPEQRLTHVYFRREFSLDTSPLNAEINIYAYNLYQLFINGRMIGSGPARSYPEYPEYDTYQIGEYLREGENVIAVNVQHHGVATYHHLGNPGAFTATGRIKTLNSTISLDTAGEWLCRESKGYKTNPQLFSFAIGPVQTFDARRENDDWKFPGIPSGEWDTPTLLKIPEQFKFFPRSIPYLSNDELSPAKLLSANYHLNEEQYYSLSIYRQFDPAMPKPGSGRAFVYSYIYSPRKQSLDCGGWWGEYFVNGSKITMTANPEINLRLQGVMELEAGWNFFLFSVGAIKDICEMHLAVPVAAELTFSANCKMDVKKQFRVTDIFEDEFADPVLKAVSGKKLAELRELEDKWNDYILPEIPDSNPKYLSWIRFGENVDFDSAKLENIEIEAANECTLIVDMGNICLGRIFVEYDAPENTIIDIGYAEVLFDKRPRYGKNALVNSAERQICAGGSARMETFAPRGFRYLQITVTGHKQAVTISKAGVMLQIYPYAKKGEFECSDQDFNKLYEWGWRTLQLCSEDVITDCPWRERTLYGGDLLPEAATAMVMSGDMRLVKRSIEIFLQSQDENTGWLQSMAPMRRDRESLFDYPPLVLLNTEWYCRLTEDVKFAERAYPVFRKMLEHALEIRDESGLFSATYHVFIEHNYSLTGGVVTAFNALMVSTFSAWASLLTMLNRNQEADEALAISKDISLRISQKLWDEKVAAFADGIIGNELCATHGIAANSWPKLFADIDAGKWGKSLSHMQKIMKKFNPYEEEKAVSTYGAFYYLGALYKAGKEGLAEESIHKIYSYHLLHPTGTIWEHAHPSGSLVHAWSTAPNFYFATRILGVQLGFPEATDLTKITIAPQAESIEWAKGTVPHPLGMVKVDWKIDGNSLFLEYHVPAGVEVIISPRGRLADLELVV